MGITLQDRLNNCIKNTQLTGSLPVEVVDQRYIIFPADGGFIDLTSSKYLLLPVEINRILLNDFMLDLKSKDIKKTCVLCIEKNEGEPAKPRVIYDFSPLPRTRL